MELTVNGAATEVPDGCTLDQLVERVAGGRRGVAAAVADEVVPSTRWAATPLQARARVEIVRAVAGG